MRFNHLEADAELELMSRRAGLSPAPEGLRCGQFLACPPIGSAKKRSAGFAFGRVAGLLPLPCYYSGEESLKFMPLWDCGPYDKR